MTAKVVTPEFKEQRLRASDPRIAQLSDLYKHAESELKKAEQQAKALLIPSLNELRYAGHHLLKALTAKTQAEADYEFHEAESHCKRAIFDAVEIRLMDHLSRIDVIETTYRSIEIAPHIPNYHELRREYMQVRETLSSVDHNCREQYLGACQYHLEHLHAYCLALDIADPELRKASVKDRNNTRNAIVLTVIGVLTLFFAASGPIKEWFSHAPQPQPVISSPSPAENAQ